MNVGILHPGEMGVTVAASLKHGGHRVLWTSERRSAATRKRAEAAGLEDAEFITALCEQAHVIICVCPPAAAETVANSVAARKFNGIYIDANAISPERARRIGAAIEAAGGRFVDGGIIGPPAKKAGTTWIHLSGTQADEMAGLFAAGPLESRVVGNEPGHASALKMCYAAYTKGTNALLCAILGAAERLGVRDQLREQWSLERSKLDTRAPRELALGARKAWRFVAEMEEIAATMRGAGLPGGFHEAAAEVYRRLESLKDQPPESNAGSVLAALLRDVSDRA